MSAATGCASAAESPSSRSLRYDADLTVPEIARLTGAAEGTIKSRLHNAIQKLRRQLQTEDES